MEKEIIRIQLAWFFENNYNDSFEAVSFKIKEKLGNSEETQYIPVPSSAPSELPRLILKYKNFSINFSKNRADFYFKNFDDINKKNIKEITSLISEEFKINIVRIGFVKSFFVLETLDYLKNLFKEEKISGLNLKEISVRLNAIKKIADINCNSIEDLTIGKAARDGIVRDGLIINRDINTSIEEKNSFNDSEKTLSAVNLFNEEADTFLI